MSNQILNILNQNKSISIGKIGFSELKILYSFLSKNQLTQQDLHDIFVVAGVFPPNQKSINDFCDEMIQILPEVDVLAKMKLDVEKEDYTIKHLCKNPTQVKLRELEPYYWDIHWTSFLENKKVLIISPFVKTIKTQYEKRLKLWNTEILPNMDIEYIQSPLSHYLIKSEFNCWTSALNSIKHQMSEKTFDVCLIGAGAWSLPLAVHAKKLKKIGIHMGGPLQILFGIKGKRWDNHDVISKFYNDFWVRPSEEETPEKKIYVEGGCYW